MRRIVDLTMSYDVRVRGFRRKVSKQLDTDGWNASQLEIYSHSGTHMDAPWHFGVSDKTIDQVPVDQLVGPAWVIDLNGIEARTLIGIDDLGTVAGRFSAGESLLIRTGWDRLAGTPEYRSALPRVSEELARWCAEKKVRMLGVEPPSVADVNNIEEITLIHRILLGGGVIIVEGLANLDALKEEQVELIALPLKIAGGDGAPARVIAVEGK